MTRTAAGNSRKKGGPGGDSRRRGSRRRTRWLLFGAFMAGPVALAFVSFFYGVLGVFILAGIFGALAALRQAREIQDTPTSKIRSATQGYVELVLRGSATDAEGHPITGPLSGKPCCYWQLDAQRRVKRGDDEEWQTEAFARSVPELLPIGDGTGTCYLAVAEADFHAIVPEERSAGEAERAAVAHLFPEHQRARLGRSGRWRLKETALPADTELYALGRFTSYRSNELPFDDSWAERMAGADEGIPIDLRGMARSLQNKRAPSRDAADARWRAEMRRLEGIPPDAPLSGSVVAHVLSADWDGRRDLIVGATSERGMVRNLHILAIAAVVMSVIATAILVAILFDDYPDMMWGLVASLGLPAP